MKLLEFNQHLKSLKRVEFILPSGEAVPSHFHVTEVGKINKQFIDCGGTLHHDMTVNFQLWNADDYDHRLHPEKLLHIIDLSQKTPEIADSFEIEVEYQG